MKASGEKKQKVQAIPKRHHAAEPNGEPLRNGMISCFLQRWIDEQQHRRFVSGHENSG